MSVNRTNLASRRRFGPLALTSAEQRRRRRRLAEQDRLSARLTELHAMRSLLTDAAGTVRTGWIQHAWFLYRDEFGRQQGADTHRLHLLAGTDVTGACLVGAIVHAVGGLPQANSQHVQRTLDLAWHALHEDPNQPVRWCPGPAVRALHTRDLTRWNDHADRTYDDVLAAIHAIDELAARLIIETSSRLHKSTLDTKSTAMAT